MRKQDAIAVALAADTRFSRQLAVVIAGLTRGAGGTRHEIYVLHDGYDDELIARVSQSAGSDVELRWIGAASSRLDAALLPGYLPIATLFRLRMPELLPPDVDRVLYIDTDTVVRQPLSELWVCDIGDAVLGAVRDPTVPWAAAPQGLDWSKFGLAPDTPYFNAGVQIIPLDRWRAEGICDRALELLSVNGFRHGDQCALNVVAAGNWCPLEPRWNVQAGHVVGDSSLAWITETREALQAARDRPGIVHFNHSNWRRPWEHGSTHPLRHLWYEDLDRTAWAGWRPEGPGIAARAGRRLKRAGKVLLHG